MKKHISKITQIILLIFLVACNPEERELVFSEPQPITDTGNEDPVDDDTDDDSDSQDDSTDNPNTLFTADVFFIDRNTLYGVRDDFFEAGHQGTGEITTAFLELTLPSDGQIGNQSTPLVYSANNEVVNDYSNLRLTVASIEGTLTSYAPTNNSSNWAELWSITLEGGLFAGPAVVGNGPNRTLLVGDANGNIHAVAANTGTKIWSWNNPNPTPSFIAPLEIMPENNLVIAASFGGFVFALDTQNGNILWEFEAEGLITGKPFYAKNPSDSIPSIIIATQEGTVIRIDRATGLELWKTTLPPDRFSSTSTQFVSSAPSSDGTENGVFVASANSSFFNLDITSGAINWDSEDVQFEDFRSSIFSLNDTYSVGISSFGTFYQFTRTGPTFGDVTWDELQLPNANESGITGSPLLVESAQSGYGTNRIYVKTAIGLYGIDQGAKEIASKFEFGTSMGNSPSSPVAIGSTSSDDVRLFYPPNIDDDNQIQ